VSGEAGKRPNAHSPGGGAGDQKGGMRMKVLVCCLLLSIASLVYAAEELVWTAVDIPGLEFTGDAILNYGLWFHGDFGWLNAGRQLWTTHDAGRSWTLSLTAPDKHQFYDSYFVNSLEGWVVVWPRSLFHTEDGGISWEEAEVQLTEASGEHIGAGLTRVYFRDSLNGLGAFAIAGGFYPAWLGGIIARTEDGGKHWTKLTDGPLFPRLTGFGNAVWIDGPLESGYYSSDFGNTIRPIPILGDDQAVFASPLYGWTVDADYVGEEFGPCRRWDVLKTTNRGNEWAARVFSRTTCVQSSIRDICLMSEEMGAILWYSRSEEEELSLLYVTYNGGISWLSYHVPVEPDYYKISCNRQRRELWMFPFPYSLGEGGTLFYTSIDIVAEVRIPNRLFTTWALIKEARKEH